MKALPRTPVTIGVMSMISLVTSVNLANASGSSVRPQITVSPFLYTATGNFSSGWGLQGIKGTSEPGFFVITGTSDINGVVYKGPVNNGFNPYGSGKDGTWYLMNVPGAASTSIYGPEDLGQGTYNLVGTYTLSNQSQIFSFFYQGPLSNSPSSSHYQTVQARYPNGQIAENTILHSVSGGLAAGNYGSPNTDLGHAFVWDPENPAKPQTDLVFPDADKTHSVYGIWHNGGMHYTVAGGVGGNVGRNLIEGPVAFGYLMDYDRATGLTSNYQIFSYSITGKTRPYFKRNTVITHFEGIWSNGQGLYRLPASVTSLSGGLSLGMVVEVARKPSGAFSDRASWNSIRLSGSSFSTNDSLFGETSIGVVQYVQTQPNTGATLTTTTNFAITPAQSEAMK